MGRERRDGEGERERGLEKAYLDSLSRCGNRSDILLLESAAGRKDRAGGSMWGWTRLDCREWLGDEFKGLSSTAREKIWEMSSKSCH